MTRRAVVLSVLLVASLAAGTPGAEDTLRQEFLAPPDSTKPWCYGWWLNGAASKEGITRDFEEIQKQGIAGALLFDAGEAGSEAPRGPQFMSDPWRELYKHAVCEADRPARGTLWPRKKRDFEGTSFCSRFWGQFSMPSENLAGLGDPLPPDGFERLSQRLLREYEFQNVTVEGRSPCSSVSGPR
jgi:hypothetical protein